MRKTAKKSEPRRKKEQPTKAAQPTAENPIYCTAQFNIQMLRMPSADDCEFVQYLRDVFDRAKLDGCKFTSVHNYTFERIVSILENWANAQKSSWVFTGGGVTENDIPQR